MYLKHWNEVSKLALPSLNYITNFKRKVIFYASKGIIAETSFILLVNGAAIEASASLKERPISASLRALQSFVPSPQKPNTIFSMKSPHYLLNQVDYCSFEGLILSFSFVQEPFWRKL